MHLDPDTVTESQVAGLVDQAGLDRVDLVVDAEPTPAELGRLLERVGFELIRTTLQLRVPLPLAPERAGHPPAIALRPFRVDQDEPAWLAVNNRAFAWHPDQSNRTLDQLRALEAQPWFRADGFLVHEDPSGQLDGFCWTKVHRLHRPPLGEIYVIGVDPDAHGRGLGRALVVAGLDWLAGQGLTHGMLYVEADNAPARHLYESLGFTEHHAHRWWRLARPADLGRATASDPEPGEQG